MIALDGTPNKGRLGANAMLGVSMAARPRRRGRGEPAALHAPRVARRTAGASRHCCPCR